jgi:hypothetical protein
LGFHLSITSLPAIGNCRRVLTVSGALIALSSSACGTDTASETRAVTPTDGGATTAPAPAATPTAPATVPTESAPTGTTTAAPTAGATATTPAPTGGAAAPGDDGGAEAAGPSTPGGDEQGNRVPAAFTVSAARTSPPMITVPPFLGIELRVTSGDGAAHLLTLRVSPPVTVAVPASGTATRMASGLPAGTYKVDVDGRAGAATLRVADDAGP